MTTRFSYAMKFVANMDAAVTFHRDVLGFAVKFQSPFWSELATGETTLALHLADGEHQAGLVRMGISVPDMKVFQAQLASAGLEFSKEPTMQHGTLLGEFVDPEGAFVSVSEARK